MDKIINYLLLVIIFVFDPLAISLVIAANFAFEQLKSKSEEKIIEKEVIKEIEKLTPVEVEKIIPLEIERYLDIKNYPSKSLELSPPPLPIPSQKIKKKHPLIRPQT